MKDYMKESCHFIADNYGINSQICVAIEEMSELQKELCKYKRNQNNIPSIAEEIADVKIMLEQLEHLFGIDITVENQMDYKLNRQLERMKEERR